MYFLIEFEPLCQKLWAFLPNFGFFTMSVHQIWSFHMTQDANFGKFLFCPDSTCDPYCLRGGGGVLNHLKTL